MAVHTINGLSICAGSGASDLGLGLCLGSAYRTVCYIEREAYAAAHLVTRMGRGLDQAPIWSDLTTFDGRPWRGVVDLIVAGLPCQPHSVAGARAGSTDERWLWPEFIRVVAEVQPSIVILENVRGLLSSRTLRDDPNTAGLVFGAQLESLAYLGYVGAWGVVEAADVGGPHFRPRVFSVAAIRPDADGILLRLQRWWCESGPNAARLGDDGASRDVADTMRFGLLPLDGDDVPQRQTDLAWSGARQGDEEEDRKEDVADADGERCEDWIFRLDSPGGPDAGRRSEEVADEDVADTDSERCEVESSPRVHVQGPRGDDTFGRGLWGCDPWRTWEVEPDVGRVADGVAKRVAKLRLAGGGIVPQQLAAAVGSLSDAILRKGK